MQWLGWNESNINGIIFIDTNRWRQCHVFKWYFIWNIAIILNNSNSNICHKSSTSNVNVGNGSSGSKLSEIPQQIQPNSSSNEFNNNSNNFVHDEATTAKIPTTENMFTFDVFFIF